MCGLRSTSNKCFNCADVAPLTVLDVGGCVTVPGFVMVKSLPDNATGTPSNKVTAFGFVFKKADLTRYIAAMVAVV